MINITDFVNQRVKPNDHVLDLGCGDCKVSNTLECEVIVTVDIWKRSKPTVLCDLSLGHLPFEDQSFDVVLMLDIVEHLDKCCGRRLIKEAQRVCNREIILLTPLIWDDNKEPTNNPKSFYYGNKHNFHRSLWAKKDFLSSEGWERQRVEKSYYYVGVWTCPLKSKHI